MSSHHDHHGDTAPGEHHRPVWVEIAGYSLGLILALGLTGVSFWAVSSQGLWGPGIGIGLCVLAVAQMGVHLVFFLHLSTGPDNTNNVLALAFGILIVFLVVAGSLWIMANLNANMSMTTPMTMQMN